MRRARGGVGDVDVGVDDIDGEVKEGDRLVGDLAGNLARQDLRIDRHLQPIKQRCPVGKQRRGVDAPVPHHAHRVAGRAGDEAAELIQDGDVELGQQGVVLQPGVAVAAGGARQQVCLERSLEDHVRRAARDHL